MRALLPAVLLLALFPAMLTIAVGDSVTWSHGGAHDHTDSDANGFDSGTLHPGATFQQAFPKAGTCSYHCSIHPTMTATITVQ
jgi:plastocyanin